MGVETTFNFDNAANFNLVNTQIQSNKAKLAIIPNPGQVFSQAFSADTGFTYDNTKAEFVGGVVRQKDQRPVSAVLGGNFQSSMDLNWADSGSLLAGLTDTPTLSGGKIQCLGGGNVGVYYDTSVISTIGNSGAIKFRLTPNYSGTPAANTGIIAIKNPANLNNYILLFHGSTGAIRYTAYDNSGVLIYSAVNLATWSPISGTEYEFELNWNASGGATRLFINGVQLGSTLNTVYTRSTGASRLHLGTTPTYAVADESFDDLLLFNTAQHTANYTPGYTVPSTIYLGSQIDLPTFTYTGLGTIQAVESSTVTETGTPRYIIAGKYWNGSAWVTSNYTYAQANTSAQVIANLPSLTVTGAGSFVVSIIFTDSNTQSNVDFVSVTVTGQKYSPTGYLEPVQSLEIQDLISYAQTATLPGSTKAKVILKIDGVLKYHNGSAWVTSDGSEAQSNFAVDLDAAFADLNLSQNSTLFLRWLLITPSNTDTPELENATLEYDFGAVESEPTTCLVYGYLKDIAGLPIQGALVTFSLVRTTTKEYKEASSNIIFKPTTTVTSDVNGYFEVELIRSSEYEGTGSYSIAVTKDTLETSKKGSNILKFSVPDATTKDITDLLVAS